MVAHLVCNVVVVVGLSGDARDKLAGHVSMGREKRRERVHRRENGL